VRDTRLPSKLYRYQPFNATTLANLKNRLWYFSSPTAFNDPYECRHDLRTLNSSASAIELFRAALRSDVEKGKVEFEELLNLGPAELAQSLDRQFAESSDQVFRSLQGRGVCCFSARVDSLLMWGHYADGHRGFCLEFDTSSTHFDKFKKVEYFQECPSLSISRMLAGETDSAFDAIMCSKPADWAHEEEWRALHEKAGTEYCFGTEALSGVYFGARMPFVHLELAALVLSGSKTRMFKTRIEPGSYRLTFEQVSYTPHREAGGGGA